jgi:hypothetical protein
MLLYVATFLIANRTNELNYDIINDPTVPQLQANQAYAESESQQLPQNSDEPIIYEVLSDLPTKYAQVLVLEGDRKEGAVL